MMTRRDPYVNVMRGTIAAFSAGLGGADTISVLPHTLALGLPDSLARRLVRNGQLILLRESNLGFVADPAAGAGGFEALTKTLGEKSWALFQAFEGKGGLPKALVEGEFQREVAKNAEALRRDIARVKAPITGVSAHPKLDEAPAEIAPGAPAPQVVPVAEGGLAPIRLAEAFEALRDRSDAFLAKHGQRPKAYLVANGPEPTHRPRVGFTRDWLEAGGFEPVYDGESKTPEEAARRFNASGAQLAFLCGADASYAERGQAFAAAVMNAGPKGVLLAGRPGADEAELRSAGIDSFIFMGGDAITTLEEMYRKAE